MKVVTNRQERVATRAYYLHRNQNGRDPHDHVSNWVEAEEIEVALTGYSNVCADPAFPEDVYRIIETEYLKLCSQLSILPLPVDCYLPAQTEDFTALGTNRQNLDPGYCHSKKYIIMPFDISWVPGPQPNFPPTSWDLRAPDWPDWRSTIWHETVHQLSDVMGRWDGKESGVSLGAMNPSRGTGHGVGWIAALKEFASRFQVAVLLLDDVL